MLFLNSDSSKVGFCRGCRGPFCFGKTTLSTSTLSTSLAVFIGLKPRSSTFRKTRKPTFESPLETKEDLSG